MSKCTRIILIILAVIVLIVLWLMFCGYEWTWGPFGKMGNLKYRSFEGNSDEFALENVESLDESVLKGKDILFLGSSVTYGANSLQTSFVEYIAKRNDCSYLKWAVSGTTLVNNGPNSYVERLKTVDKDRKFDVVVCQLSTNDASQKKKLGSANDTGTHTICGAINYIIDYSKSTWNCPVVFYTNPYYESEEYSNMVEALKQISTIKDITIIDLYNDVTFNDISQDEYNLYMADKIHPTKAGYLKWWTPKFEEILYKVFK
ncbi:MAG: SGNH/GDSL hydrolase family protein [Clostridia bacterium]|nr:SGNH/GDSL hydrolase family protein [Clostridia bacterium]